MIPQPMLIMHDPENGASGDCFRACIASLIEVPAARVPHFMEKPDGVFRCRVWLRDMLLDFLQLPFRDDLDAIQDAMNRLYNGNFYILSGTSERGVNHCVICQDGRIVHDPMPGGTGLAGPCDDGHYWVGVVTIDA